MYPFNLKRALRGDKLVRRDGKVVDAPFIRRQSSNQKSVAPFPFACGRFDYTERGSLYYDTETTHEADLFMAEPDEIPFDLGAALKGARFYFLHDAPQLQCQITSVRNVGEPNVQFLVNRMVFGDWYNEEALKPACRMCPPKRPVRIYKAPEGFTYVWTDVLTRHAGTVHTIAVKGKRTEYTIDSGLAAYTAPEAELTEYHNWNAASARLLDNGTIEVTEKT